MNSARVELLDHARLRAQFASLERRTARGGKDSIDHAPKAYDDIANAVAGALVLAGEPYYEPLYPLIFVAGALASATAARVSAVAR